DPEHAMVIRITLCRGRAIPKVSDRIFVLDALDILGAVRDPLVERTICARGVDEHVNGVFLIRASFLEVYSKELPVHRGECHLGTPFGRRLQVNLWNWRQYCDRLGGLLHSHHQYGSETFGTGV